MHKQFSGVIVPGRGRAAPGTCIFREKSQGAALALQSKQSLAE